MNKAIAIGHFAIFESGHVKHAIAIKGVVFVFGLKQGVFGVAKINTIDVFGYFAFDDFQVGGIDFFPKRRPSALQVGVIACNDVAVIGVDNFFFHKASLHKSFNFSPYVNSA